MNSQLTKTKGEMKRRMRLSIIVIAILLVSFFNGNIAQAASAAGYSEYYIPGDELSMWRIFTALDPYAATAMHCIISVTAWSDNTTVYYDHWEDGYDFDPANPSATADEQYTIPSAGGVLVFEDANIPTNPRGTAEFYDGEDRIYVAGGAVTVTRASWIEAKGVGNQAAAWEIYPVTPQLTTYVLPFGEDLPFVDFQRVFVLVQATADATTVQFDFNDDGIYDTFCTDPNRAICNVANQGTQITLDKGESFLLDNWVLSPQPAPYNEVHTGTVIRGNQTLQVKYIAGQPLQNSLARGFSAFPRGFWTKDYYAPADEPSVRLTPNTDYYLYNPHSTPITINWESRTSSGSFPVGANTTVSYRTATGGNVPVDSGLYFKGSDVFWGVGVGDAGDNLYEWGFSLLPSTMLYDEHFLGWAPASNPVTAGRTDNGVFLTVAQDNTRVFVDVNNDGTTDQTYTLDRLQTQYITDPDGDLSRAHFWATGPFTLAYGQDADTAATPGPPGGIDLGYVAIPGTDFISLVLTVDKAVSPQIIPTASGSVATFTIKVNSQKYIVDGVNVTDYLPPNWDYVAGTDTTIITRPDMTTFTGAGADPAKSGTGPYNLYWDSTQLTGAAAGHMDENQEISITFTARTTAVLATGTLSQNRVKAIGTRLTGTPEEQTFTATDFTYVVSGELQITKTSGAADPVYPGDTIPYTVTVTNPSATVTLTGISLYDPLPEGVSFNSGTVSYPLTAGAYTYNDTFGTASYTNSNGTALWRGSWQETNDDSSPSTGKMLINAGRLEFRGTSTTDTFSIERPVPLGGTSGQTLTFTYSRNGTCEAADQMLVEFYDGTTWQTVTTISGNFATPVTFGPFNISAWANANSRIRFTATGYSQAGPERWQLENIVINFTSAGTVSGPLDSPPEFISSSDGYSLTPGQQMTLTYNVTVDDPLASGIGEITNTAYVTSNEIPLPLSASVTNILVNPSSASAEVGDRVWLDGDGDGVQDAGEPGIANVEVTLKDQYGAPLMTTITDSTGHYLFSGVTPGVDYYVEVTAGTLPAGLIQSAPSGHTDNRTDPFDISLYIGNNRDQFDTIAYTNNDGTLNWAADWAEIDAGAAGASGGYIRVTGGQLRINNASGVTTQSITRGYDLAGTGATTATLTFDFNTSGNLENADVIYVQYRTGGSGGFTTFAGGIYTDDYPVGSNATFTIPLASPANLTEIRFAIISASAYTGTGGGGTPNEFFYVDNVNVEYYRETLNDYLDADLGYTSNASTAIVGTFVWSDANSNGLRDAGEAGLGGVTVQLCYDANSNGILDTGEKTGCSTTTTASDGSYLFTGVTANSARDYFVYIDETQTQLSGYSRTAPAPLTDPVYLPNIVAGSSYLFANYGYHSASTYSIKDRVWLDDGSGGGTAEDGVQNGTETGIALVTVALLDSSLNVVATATTDVNGDITFSGLTGGGDDYTVQITDTNAKLTDYYGTTASAISGSKQISNLVADVDRTSFPGTIAVTNGSAAVVGSGTTFTNYLVAGEQITISGVGYTIQSVTDNTNLVLTSNYAGATASGLAYSAPDFGYNLDRTIGTTVYNDVNGDGDQDTGELGFGGVTVKLYNDANGNGQITAGADFVIATLITDSNGNYLFTGLNDGNYIVSVESPPSGYTYTGIGGNADSDGATTGQQQAATITGGNSVLTKDFPYYAAISRSVSGTLWLDSDTDGVIDAGESEFSGVTISLFRDINSNSTFDSGVDTLESTTTTDSNGYYTFTGLPSGIYFVVITDDSGILSGYLTCYEVTEVLTGPFNSQEVTNLSSGNLSNINFGYCSPSVPTRVSLSDFRAYEQDGQVYVRWETAYEHNTLGFNLLRLDPATGRYAAVNSGLMPGIFKPQRGGIYTYRDAGAAPGGTYTYRLIEVENTGERLSYGPFTVSVGSKTDDSVSDETVISGPAGYVRMHKGDPGNQKAGMQLKSVTLKAAGAVTKTTTESGDRIRITVSENGIYYLDARDISSLLGIFRNKVPGMINNRQLSLSNQGKKVAYTPAQYNAGIYFYGTGIESLYTKENVYWLDKKKGTTMQVLRGRGPAPSPNVESFVETLHFEQDENPVQQLFNDPGADYWFWAQLYASSFWTDDPIDLTFEAPGLSESQNTATIQMQLFGGSDAGVANDHHVKVSLNGVLIDDYWWTGLTPFTITFTAPLTAGVNTLTVVGIAEPGVYASSVFIDSFDVTYQRRYEASGDRLAFKGDGNMPVTVGGFTSPDIMVFDVTDPLLPIVNTATTVEPDTTGYMVSLNPAAASARYFSVTGRTIQRVSGKAVVEPSLSSGRNAADYIIIAPAGLISTAQELAKHRRGQGYKTMVLDVEDIMNEFNYGISNPEAIKEFLSYAYSNWKTRPRYAVLAGDGSMDYKDNLGLGYGGNLIPSRMVPTPHGLFVSDNYLADFNGDYVPEIAIGRLPVTTPDELLTVIRKIQTYERAPVNKNVVLVADAFDPEAGDFISDSDLLAEVFPTGYTLQKIYLNNYNPATVNAAKSALVTAINNGAAFFNYVGHAGPNQLTNAWPGLINHYTTNPAYYLDDVPLFVNSVLPVMTAMTCLVGNFSDPYQIILTEALVLKADSGIAAAWAPTGLSDDAEASILNREFYKAFLSGRNQAIGDVVRKALSAYQRQGTMPYMIDIYNILGDPALRMR